MDKGRDTRALRRTADTPIVGTAEWPCDRIAPSIGEMFLQTLHSAGPAQDALRHHLERATNRGARPIVVLVEPGDALGTVLDQMRAEDVLVIAHTDARRVVGWAGLYGSRAIGPDDAEHITDKARLCAIPIDMFTQMYGAAAAPALRLREVTT